MLFVTCIISRVKGLPKTIIKVSVWSIHHKKKYRSSRSFINESFEDFVSIVTRESIFKTKYVTDPRSRLGRGLSTFEPLREILCQRAKYS